MIDTQYLIDLDNSLKFYRDYRKALVEAARNGDLLAGCIIDRILSIGAGDYRESSIRSLNAEVQTWQATHV